MTDDYGYERWAQRETSAGKYTYWNVLRDAETGKGKGQPSWCTPYRCFLDTDKRRQHRTRGRSVAGYETRDSDTTVDRADRDQRHQLDTGQSEDSPVAGHWTNGSLLDLHMELNGGTGLTPKGHSGWAAGYHVARNEFGRELRVSNQRQLEACRKCGKDLGLPRCEFGYVIREARTQRQYCSDRCEADADNRRDRQRRAGGKFPKDEYGWFIQTPPQRRKHQWKTYRYSDLEATVPHTVSRDYRLRLPWAGEPDSWKIAAVSHLTQRYGALAP